MKTTAATIAGILVVAVLCVGVYLGSWWLRGDGIDRQAQINQQTFGRQNALVEQILDDIAEAEDPDIAPAQRVAIVDIVCDSAAKLTGSIALPRSATAFVAMECNS